MANNSRKKWVKGILIGISIFLLVFIASALILPIVFKKQILEAVKKAANEQLTAKIDFRNLDISEVKKFYTDKI
jgi:anionic cell wall polymer biosynthesis LytR-Cps2A-Psr (LCP) family protein